MPKIFLIGYMGSGKTTIGRLLAKKTGLAFIDADLFIENRFRKSVASIFEERGEAGFREIERKVLEEIIGFEDVVISTGGGLPCFFDNMELMNRNGVTVYLKASTEELVKRLEKGKKKRPLICDKNDEELKEFVELNVRRRSEYYDRALYTLETGALASSREIEEKVEELIAYLLIDVIVR